MTFRTPLTPDADVCSRALNACYQAIAGGNLGNTYVRTAVMDCGNLRQEWVHTNDDGTQELIVLSVGVSVHREPVPHGR